jgi:hypothetical protein
VASEGWVWQQVQRNDSNSDVYSLVLQPSGGNVGIGTTSITNGTTFGGGGQINRLKVQSTNYTCLEINGSTSGGSVQFTYGTNSPNQVAGLIGYNYASGTVNEFVVSNALSGPLIFAASNTERMRITSGGNVGIGETSPGSKLHVSGDTFTNGRFALPFGSVRTYSALGNITINVGNLPVLDGNNWRQASIMVFYSGVSGGLEQGYHNVTFIRLRGLTSWNDLNVTDIVGSASISLSSNTTTGCILTLNVNSIITGSAMAMLASGTSGQLS